MERTLASVNLLTGAGDGNRTPMAGSEDWSFTPKGSRKNRFTCLRKPRPSVSVPSRLRARDGDATSRAGSRITGYALTDSPGGPGSAWLAVASERRRLPAVDDTEVVPPGRPMDGNFQAPSFGRGPFTDLGFEARDRQGAKTKKYSRYFVFSQRRRSHSLLHRGGIPRCQPRHDLGGAPPAPGQRSDCQPRPRRQAEQGFQSGASTVRHSGPSG